MRDPNRRSYVRTTVPIRRHRPTLELAFSALILGGGLLVLGASGCAGARAAKTADEPNSGAGSFDPAVAVGMPKPKTEEQMRAEATQNISFEEDGDAGPPEEIKRQPKRKPLPRFRLYGEGPAPNP